MNTPLYPEIKVELVGQDGNAFAVLGRVAEAMRKAGLDQSVIDAFKTEATNGDYNHLLCTVMNYVSIGDDWDDDDDDWDDNDDDY